MAWKKNWGLISEYEIQDSIDYYNEFEKSKIIVPAIIKDASYILDNDKFYSNDKSSIIRTDDLYLLGLLNSSALNFALHSIASTKQGGYFEYKPTYIKQLPIRTIDFLDLTEKARHKRMVELVEHMLDLNKKLAEAKAPQTKTVLKHRIETTDRQIGRLVYEFYMN